MRAAKQRLKRVSGVTEMRESLPLRFSFPGLLAELLWYYSCEVTKAISGIGVHLLSASG